MHTSILPGGKTSRRWFLIATLLLTLPFRPAHGREVFDLTMRYVDVAGADAVGGDYYFSMGRLGFMLNGHGLPDQRRTFVIFRKPAGGKPELIWPAFDYGHDQANAAVIGNTVVFAAFLTNGNSALMAARPGQAPVVISAAVLRFAVSRLGYAAIVPEAEYTFQAVRQPPGRVWIQAVRVGAYGTDPFGIEIYPDDLTKIVDDALRRGKKMKAGRFDYVAENLERPHLSRSDTNGIVLSLHPVEPAIRKGQPAYSTPPRLYGDTLMDAANHFAYLSTVHQPARLLKVDLGAKPETSPRVVGELILEPQEDDAFYGVIDAKNGFAYWGTQSARLVKVGLGSGSEPLSRIGSVLLRKDYRASAGVVDPETGYGYFTSGYRVYKVKLGKGDEPPTVVASIDLPDGTMSDAASAVLDPLTHYVYFGTDWVKIYKIAPGAGDAPPRLASQLTVPDDERGLRGALIDPQQGCAWFTSADGTVVKVALGEKDEPPRRLGALKLDPRFRYLEYTFGRDADGYGYFGTTSGGDADAAILKVALGKSGELPRLASILLMKPGEDYFVSGAVDPVTRTICVGIGSIDCSLLKLSLGEGDAAPKVIGKTDLK